MRISTLPTGPVAGADTHAETHTLAVITAQGAVEFTEQFTADTTATSIGSLCESAPDFDSHPRRTWTQLTHALIRRRNTRLNHIHVPGVHSTKTPRRPARAQPVERGGHPESS